MRFMSFGAPNTDTAGWVCYATETAGLYAFARLAQDAHGQFVVRDLLVSAEDRISATGLQSVKVGQIEREANAWPDWMREALLKAPAERDAFVASFREGMVRKGEPLSEKLAKGSRPRLTRPGGEDPERFYALVARAYREVSAQTPRPAPVLADEAGVPVATVRRWIAEARRRGHLPPGRAA
ncbi:hypothetical protein [Streptomyces sp. NBC_00582]|uniref:hypothetical protein n=1 Tax=Streptomyces sp. NBC_00582 TaxID=2975783 RepID=UPI002E805A5A|nr:hypothetical protein [Streptomyces sp. NBC_00582]WUB60445.1 hypothetical protein OG852_08635 [Streptomyces sp. NBC_00582]